MSQALYAEALCMHRHAVLGIVQPASKDEVVDRQLLYVGMVEELIQM